MALIVYFSFTAKVIIYKSHGESFYVPEYEISAGLAVLKISTWVVKYASFEDIFFMFSFPKFLISFRIRTKKLNIRKGKKTVIFSANFA